MLGEAHDLERALKADRLDAANRTAVRGLPFAVVGSTLLAFLLGESVSVERKVEWVALMIAASLFAVAVGIQYQRRRKTGPVYRWRIGVVSSAVVGAAWGSIALIAFPPADRGDLRAIVLLFAVGVSSVTLLSTAASRARFLAVNVPMTGLMAIVYIGNDDATTRLLGLAIPLYLGVMWLVHFQVHHIVVSEMRLRHELRDAAMHDGLTGVLNRKAFTAAVDDAVVQARRSGEIIGILYLDLDRFKAINDLLGHAAGDHVLVEVATRTRRVLRAGDECGRLGGDEFALLVRGLEGEADLALVAQRVLGVLAEPVAFAGDHVVIGASIGGSVISPTHDGPALLRESDAAQYRAKKAGGSRSITYDAAMRSEIERERSLENDLRHALSEGRVVPYFQPVVDLETGAVVSCEALARWQAGTGEVIAAGRFLPVARAAGLVDVLDGAIVRQAMAARVRLRDAGFADTFRIWINVDAHRMTHRGRARLQELLEATGCEPHELGLEITETGVLDDVDAAATLLADARAAGMQVALDDFGTGFSSLMLLRRLPIDVVKIDRSFVTGVVANPGDRAIVGVILQAGRDLGLRVVAEGVETEAQADVLRELGCDGAQGFLYAPAVPLGDLVALARERSTLAAS